MDIFSFQTQTYTILFALYLLITCHVLFMFFFTSWMQLIEIWSFSLYQYIIHSSIIKFLRSLQSMNKKIPKSYQFQTKETKIKTDNDVLNNKSRTMLINFQLMFFNSVFFLPLSLAPCYFLVYCLTWIESKMYKI